MDIASDDEAIVENEDEPEYDVKSDDIVKDTLRTGLLNVIPYGWLILGMVIVIYYLYNKYSYRLFKLSDTMQAAVAKKDDDSGMARAEAMERSRLRLQEEMDKKTQLYKEQQKQEEEQRRLKALKNLDEKLAHIRSKVLS